MNKIQEISGIQAFRLAHRSSAYSGLISTFYNGYVCLLR